MAVCDAFPSVALPHEILKLEDDTAALIVAIDGVDYILVIQRAPKQRPRRH